MNYNIYNEISDDRFQILKTEINYLKQTLINTKYTSFKVFNSPKEVDSLNINLFKEDDFYWNIAFVFNDSKVETFSLSILKYYDSNGYRHAYKENLYGNLTLSEIKEKLLLLLNQSINRLESVEKKDMSHITKLSNPY